MNAPIKILAAAVCGLLLGLPAALAGEMPIRHFINLGTAQDPLTIHPRGLTLQVGETYQFVVSNPSKEQHVVAAPELAAMVKTAELTTEGLPRLKLAVPALDIATGITLQPGQMIEWTFTPLVEGAYKFGCNDPAHAAAGMHTMIDVRTQDVL